MLKSFLARFLEAGATLVVLCGGFAALGCASHDELSPPARRAVTTRVTDLSPSQAAHIAQARERVRWVGQAHHNAMLVILDDIKTRRATNQPQKPRSQDRCKLLEQAGRAALITLDKGRGFVRSSASQNAELESVPGLEKCRRNMSIFANRPQATEQEIPLQNEPEVTGAYEAYLDLLESQINASDWSVGGVRAAVGNVLATAHADGIPDGDLLALASFGDLAESSAAEWNSYDFGPSNGGSCSSPERCLMSLFARRTAGSAVRIVGGADIGGCLASVKSWSGLQLLLAMPAWKALAGRCGVQGAIASAIAIYKI